jgi:hypothetical protein
MIRPTLATFVRGIAAIAVVVALAGAFAGAGTAAGATYAALGDSYSSGVGTGSYTLNSACKRSVYAYPYLWTQKHAGTALSFVACSGAKTSDVLSTQIQSVTSATTLVTLTIGGNDIGFANLIYQCTLSGCSAALDSARANLEVTLGAALDNVYTTVKSRAAIGAKIVVLGYPRVFSGVTYKSAITAFTGHAVCSSSAWLNGLNLFNTGESYHPNRGGHASGYLPLVTVVTG